MKKIFLVFVLVIVASSVFAGTLDMTGRDWMKMNEVQKSWFIAGMFMGFDMIRTAIDESPTDSTTKDEYGFTTDEYLQHMGDYFYLGVDVATVIKDLDEFYRVKSNADYYIWSSILAMYNKAWW